MFLRPDSLHAFLQQLRSILDGQDMADQERELVRKAYRSLETGTGKAREEPARRLPLCERWLEPALEEAGEASPPLRALVEAFRDLEPLLYWHHRAGSRQTGAAFHAGHANAMLLGPRGIEVRNDVWLGLTLMAPQVNYVRHQHPPEELYLVMTPGEWQQDDGPWFARRSGETVYNRPMVHHAMRSGETPLFSFWLLWNEAAK